METEIGTQMTPKGQDDQFVKFKVDGELKR